ncbi:MAG: sensor domain-containing diguanylate cyclase [Alphaproteobacteria bacterium]|nr:MAG: sensor domain-containing diguanylate cyclase [Alphaproteobacteria bacterium]
MHAPASRQTDPLTPGEEDTTLVVELDADLAPRAILGGRLAEMLWQAFAAHEPGLRSLAVEARLSGRPVMGRVTLKSSPPPTPDGEKSEKEEDGSTHSLEVCAVPEADGGLKLVARDASFEANLARALLQSRELYKDLMFCSADFGWETDAQGRFTYVSPRGALGFTPRELIGKRAADVLRLDPDSLNIFETKEPVRGVKCRVRARDGRPVILMGSAVPVAGRGGARGVARDITAEAEREQAQALDHARQALLARMVLDIRAQVSPQAVLKTVAQDAGEALRAESGWALRHREEPDAEPAITTGGALGGSAERALAALESRTGHGKGPTGDVVMELDEEGRSLLMAGARAGRFEAVVVFSRDTAREPWRAFEVELVQGLADHMTIALQQAAMLDELRTLSRTDELTGLLNRRAFIADVNARMRHQRRTGRPAALLFLDFDHFKEVNDSLGHGAGDAVLRHFGTLIRERSRAGDIAGRLGGDEFALWLEDTDLDGAKRKAASLLDLVPELREVAGDAAVPLGLSIGLVMSPAPGAETVLDLLEIADRALYAAKEQGRGRLVIAVPDIEEGQSSDTAEGEGEVA